MTKKEIIDKVYDDYLKDYGRVGYIGMNSIEKACKSEFEKNGIEYDHYDVKEALESKSHYNIVNAYVKGYSDTREGMTSSSIRDFMIQYKQGLDAGDIEYKDAEFERVAEIFKRYDKYETFNKESKDAIDGLRKDVDMYLSERSSDKESVQNAYKAINAYIYGDSSFGNLSEQVKDIDPADMKEAFNKVIEDNDYLKSWLSIMENPNRNDCSFILNDEYINPDMRDNLNEIYDKCIKDNIGDISKEPKEIQMAAKMHSFMEDYDKAYRDINDYLEGKTTKLNEGKNMNQYAVTRAFENVIIRHDGDLGLTADEIRGITKIEEIINAEEELASTFDVMNDYMEGDISIEEVKEIFDNECQPEFIANAFADMLNENSRYCVNTAYDDVEQKLKNIYKECDFDSPEFKEAFDNVSFYHLSDFVQIRNESRADNEFQKWMSDPERKSVADLREAIYDSADHRADRDNVTSLIGQAIKHAPAEMISDKQTTQKFADVTAEYSIPLSKISSFDEVKENNPEIANKFEESYKDNLKESLAEEIAVNAKWDVPYVFDDIRRDIENLYYEINENDKADIIVSAANILENKRLTGEADMSKKDVSLSLANACVAIGFTEDRSVDAIDKAVEKNPQVKDITDDMMKTAVFKDMVMDYVEDFKGFISDIENTIDQLDKSTVEKVIDDVSGRMINAYGDKKERLEEVQKAADEYVKGDKMDLNQDEISYDDDDDHDDH